MVFPRFIGLVVFSKTALNLVGVEFAEFAGDLQALHPLDFHVSQLFGFEYVPFPCLRAIKRVSEAEAHSF